MTNPYSPYFPLVYAGSGGYANWNDNSLNNLDYLLLGQRKQASKSKKNIVIPPPSGSILPRTDQNRGGWHQVVQGSSQQWRMAIIITFCHSRALAKEREWFELITHTHRRSLRSTFHLLTNRSQFRPKSDEKVEHVRNYFKSRAFHCLPAVAGF